MDKVLPKNRPRSILLAFHLTTLNFNGILIMNFFDIQLTGE